MKRRILLCLAVCANAVAAPTVPFEFLGTWASNSIDCKRIGATTLRITDNAVEMYMTHGQINAGASMSVRAIEVIFESPGGMAFGKNVRTYRLSVDGLTLQEIRAGQIVVSRKRCQVSP